MSDNYKAVTFKNSLGETISNDPIFLAQRTLAAAGISGKVDDSGDAFDENPYSDLKAAELKELAKERGVDIKGLKTVGDVRNALVAADDAEEEAAKAAEAEAANTAANADETDE